MPEAGDNPHDEPEDDKKIAVKDRGQPVTDAKADKDRNDQDQVMVLAR